MTTTEDPTNLYRRIGVRPIINASGTTTKYGGTKLRSEVQKVMNQASTIMVDIDELNQAAGKVIAEITGAEAGLVTSGAAGGLLLQAAACMAGSDPINMAKLPSTHGLKNEIMMQRSHRFPYDQAYRAAGATLVDVGDGRRVSPWEFEAGFTDRTAAVAYLFSPFVSRRALPLEQVCELSHARGVPVIVDAASFLPPRANLRRFIAEGADMVSYSGGKAIRGPQSTGILCGRADLIEAAAANGRPSPFIGRGMKVAKEEIIGLLEALRIFVDEDEDALNRHYSGMCQQIVDALIEVPGLRVSVEHDEFSYLIPHALMTFGRGWNGPSRNNVLAAMENGEPSIFLHTLGTPDEIAVDPTNLDQGELEIVIRRLREELVGS